VARFDPAIPPGGEGQITLRFDTRGYQGSMQKTALITSNDPVTPVTEIRFTLFVKTPITFEPIGVMLGGVVGEEIRAKVMIRAHLDKPLKLGTMTNTTPDKVAYTMETVQEGRVYQLEIRNTSIRADDKYSGAISIRTNYPELPEISVPYLGYIRSMGTVMPDKVPSNR
jgi:hypothetical protein